MSEKCPVILKKYMKFITIKEILRQPQYVFDSPKHIPVNLWELLGGRSPPYQLF